MELNRLFEAGSSFELGQQLIREMDIPCALNFWQHNNVDLVTYFCHDTSDVVEEPRAIKTIDARPQLSVTKIIIAGDVDKAFARRFLVFDRDGILKVA